MRRLLKVYDYLKTHKRVLWSSLISLTALFSALVFKLDFSEDISDFLPLGSSERESFSVYQKISGADKMFVLFNNPGDEYRTVEAMDCFASYVHQHDEENICQSLMVEVDEEQVAEVASFVYGNMPYFLTGDDYERMESMLSQPGIVQEQLQKDIQMLAIPSDLVGKAIARDPLGLFLPVIQKLQDFNPQLGFETVEGHIFTPDMSRSVAMMTSPFGNSETSGNARLIKLLDEGINHMNSQYPDVKAHVIGGPAIAVENADCIKKDSVIAVLLSLVLIVLLLAYSFNSVRNILLIVLSISWGWLFAMGGMALLGGSVSIIVIGISSVILGIAVNYPLHLIAHLAHQSNVREAIRDIAAPLVVGNVTTVGAFLALVPLQSTSLRDLGIFAALLLVGTIVFVLVYLPHLVKVKAAREHKSKMLDKISEWNPDKSRWVIASVVLLTLVLGFFSFDASFDDNLSNINYMTPEQREDMAYFQRLMSRDSVSAVPVYVLSQGKDYDAALQDNISKRVLIDSLNAAGLINSDLSAAAFLCCRQQQEGRLAKFTDFVHRHESLFKEELPSHAGRAGFCEGAFEPFMNLISRVDAEGFEPVEFSYFEPLASSVFGPCVTSLESTGKCYVVDRLSVLPQNLDAVRSALDTSFEINEINSALSRNLSDNFNYIALACSLIVFFFLWFSFGRIELALISFLPMAVSWLWILGLMGILGIKFNIVNVILATFIFGQGDDYTIFMTEGCQYEYTHRKPILAAYKNSILQSALIMFVGMGTLIVARHPAMRSLAELTIIGMASVVFMAWLIPPFLFRWLTTRGGKVRRYPLTLRSILLGAPKDPVAQVKGRYLYKGMSISRSVGRTLKNRASSLAQLTADENGEISICDESYGESAIFAALTHPQCRIMVKMDDGQRLGVAAAAAEGFVDNIMFIER